MGEGPVHHILRWEAFQVRVQQCGRDEVASLGAFTAPACSEPAVPDLRLMLLPPHLQVFWAPSLILQLNQHR